MNQDFENAIAELTKESPKPLMQVLFSFARQYFEAYETLSMTMSKNGNADLSAPLIMTLSFSIELLLKALIVNDHRSIFTINDLEKAGKKITGHDYIQLFSRIESSVKSKIDEIYINLYGEKIEEGQFATILESAGEMPFVHWRYVYENTGISQINIAQLDKIAHTLGRTAESILKS
jgi:hypothetical protein